MNFVVCSVGGAANHLTAHTVRCEQRNELIDVTLDSTFYARPARAENENVQGILAFRRRRLRARSVFNPTLDHDFLMKN